MCRSDRQETFSQRSRADVGHLHERKILIFVVRRLNSMIVDVCRHDRTVKRGYYTPLEQIENYLNATDGDDSCRADAGKSHFGQERKRGRQLFGCLPHFLIWQLRGRPKSTSCFSSHFPGPKCEVENGHFLMLKLVQLNTVPVAGLPEI